MVSHWNPNVSAFYFCRLACHSFLITRQNTVEELYSLIKFLRVRPLNDWHTFNEQIAKPVKAGRPVRALKRLQVSSYPALSGPPLNRIPSHYRLS